MEGTRWLENELTRAFSPTHLEIEDESDRHVGHPGARSGGAHFRVLIVSEAFRGHDPVSRQRAVYRVLGGAMGSAIHALALRTLTPEEWQPPSS